VDNYAVLNTGNGRSSAHHPSVALMYRIPLNKQHLQCTDVVILPANLMQLIQ